MKHLKRGLAVLLAAMLMVPSLPAAATEAGAPDQTEAVVMTEAAADEGQKEENSAGETPSETPSAGEEPSEAPSEEEAPSQAPSVEETPSAAPSTEEASSEESSAEETSSETSSADEKPSETPSAETPSETPSAEETPSETLTEEESETELPSLDETETETEIETETKTETEIETETETETETEIETETETETETEEPETTVSGNGVKAPESSVSGNSAPGGSVSGNSVSGNSVSGNSVKRKKPLEEVMFNTGSHVYSVVGREDFFDHELGDACFEEDGSYTINIPEENPFFPYEVQFTYDGDVRNEWFMTPDDSVEIGGHTFYVSASFDGTAVTQMSLKVAGDTVVVYPEEKEFTDEDGIQALSLLPLRQRLLVADLSAYTPIELTMVSVDSIFTGNYALKDTDNVIWTLYGDDNYKVSTSGDWLDVSCQTYNDRVTDWEMIVGENDQLALENIRYMIQVKHTPSKDWLNSELYLQDNAGKRTRINTIRDLYYDYDFEERYERIDLTSHDVADVSQIYIGLSIDPSVSDSNRLDYVRVFEGNYSTAQEAMAQREITEKIWNQDLSVIDSGYIIGVYEDVWITIVSFDSSGNPTGCLPLEIQRSYYGESIIPTMYAHNNGEISRASRGSSIFYNTEDREFDVRVELQNGYDVDREYYLTFDYSFASEINNEKVVAAFLGEYASIVEASTIGAKDIKDILFGEEGYVADYSKGITFTIFVDSHAENSPRRYCYHVFTEKGDNEENVNVGTTAWFNGLRDADGNLVNSYAVSEKEDSYAEYNYLTILVEEDTDLSALAPTFSTASGINLYAQGSSSPEVSGKSLHDFSNGPVQYTASAENGKNAKNYWLQVVKPEAGPGQLYLNSLADAEADTRTQGGTIYSTREIMLDGYHDYIHDILLANMGTEALPELSVELNSDTLELDDYWTLKGTHELSGCSSDYLMDYTGVENLAKIRLRAKSGVESGTDASGTLTIKSAGTALVVLTLTGTVGDPSIITEEIPGAVKYVPYGTMIQNSNKYSWNRVSYSMAGGRLPKGMTVRQNGEIYGVPQEAGEFTFTVRMTNSYYDFSSSERTYTLTIAENTDENVENATDTGYDLTQRIQNVTAGSGADQTLVSQGEYAQFVDIYLDGARLEKGVDYTAESGSTRITIRSQTLQADNEAGTHTLGIEFRTQDTDTLKRAAQNYEVITEGGTNPGEDTKPGDSADPGDSGDTGNDGTQGDGGNSGDSGNSGSQSGGSGGSGGSAESGSSAQNAGNANGTPQQSADGTAQEISQPDSAVGQTGQTAEAEIVSYTVQEGDTLWKISEAYYGTGKYWEEIYRLNADVIADPNRIYAGQVLKINLSLEVQPQPEREPNKIYYIVQKGDSLWSIAEKLYGQGRKWRRIYQANDIIEDPSYIYEGQAIIIP